MERDTEEWLRPWRAPGARPPAAGSIGATVTVVRSPDHPGDEEGRAGRSIPAAGDRLAAAGPGARGGSPRVIRPGASPPPGRPPAAPLTGPDRSRPASDPVPRHPGTVVPAGSGSPGRLPGDGVVAGESRARRQRPVLVGLLAGLVGAVVGTGTTLAVVDRGDPAPDEVPAAATTASSTPTPTEPTEVPVRPVPAAGVVSDVAAAVLPSVVRIDVFVTQDDPEVGEVAVPSGVGSGVVYSDDGYVLTNNHVVEDADTVRVTLGDGSERDAEIVGTDRLTDLAVLAVAPGGLVPVTLRVDEPLQVGETAVAIGSPFGLDASVTAGVVSALNRDLQVPGDGDEGAFVIPGTIQTDAAINPGNSGGALVDAAGRLIGINTAILTSNGGSQGVGFAIPTSSVIVAADQLIQQGSVSHPFLGIQGLDVTNQRAARYLADFGVELDGGAVIDEVMPGSGAADAGLRSGDVIVRFGDTEVAGMTDVIAAVLRYDAGDVVPVEFYRDGVRTTVDVTLGERPPEDG